MINLNNLQDGWALYEKLVANLDLQEEQLAASREQLVHMKAQLEELDASQDITKPETGGVCHGKP